MRRNVIFSRLEKLFPRLDWKAIIGANHTEYRGKSRDEQRTLSVVITHWKTSAGLNANLVNIEILGQPRPQQFPNIAAALDWLEWLQGVMART